MGFLSHINLLKILCNAHTGMKSVRQSFMLIMCQSRAKWARIRMQGTQSFQCAPQQTQARAKHSINIYYNNKKNKSKTKKKQVYAMQQ